MSVCRNVTLASICSRLEHLATALVVQKGYVIVSSLDSLNEKMFQAAIEALRYAPIISQNRIEGRLAFTVVPLIKPPFFDFEEIKVPDDMRGDPLWSAVSKAETLYHRGMKLTYDIPIEGILYPFPVFTDEREYWGWFMKMLSNFKGVPPIITNCVDKYESSGRALDLGCGSGAASIFLCKKGWEVVAVDNSASALAVLCENADRENSEWRKNGQLTTVTDCVTNVDFSQKYDVVVAYDVLSFIPPARLKEIFSKIFACLISGGRLVGCMLCSGDGYPYEEHLRRKGAYFLSEACMVPAMLRDSGFTAVLVQKRIMDADIPPEAIEFCAQKPLV